MLGALRDTAASQGGLDFEEENYPMTDKAAAGQRPGKRERRQAVLNYQKTCTASARPGALCIDTPRNDLIPRVLVQYWDSAPPDEVLICFRHNEQKCIDQGFQHVSFDDEGASAFMSATFGSKIAELYTAISHPAMKADFFRLAYLYDRGGFYLDADNVIGNPFPDNLSGVVALFQHVPNGVPRGLLNSFMFTYPKSEIFRTIFEHVTANLSIARRDEHNRIPLNKIIYTTGPQAVLAAVGGLLLDECFDPRAHGLSILVKQERYAPYVYRSSRLLDKQMAYKSDERSWVLAREAQRRQTEREIVHPEPRESVGAPLT